MTAPSLLIHADGANGSTTIKDSSPSALTLTVNGSVAISTAKSKFGNSSIFVPGGSVSYLSLAPSPVFYFGTVDFTVDCWINVSGYPASAQSHVFSTKVVNGFGFYIKASGQLGVAQSGVVEILSTSATIPIGSWTHVAVTRVSGVLRLFINGLQITSYSPSVTFDQGDIRIGSEGTETSFNGYIDELRINNGLGVWGGTFTPPMRPYNGADLLLHFDGVNGSTSFIDSGDNSLTLTANGAAAISTAQSEFGGTSGYFPGGTARARVPAGPQFNLGTNDFTIEAWVYPTALDTNGRAIALQAANVADNNNRAWGISLSNTALILYYSLNGSTDGGLGFSVVTSLNTWSHVRICRKAGVVYGFMNGTLISSTAMGSSIFSSTADLCIGTFGRYAEDGYPQLSFNGYIDEFYLINGAALSTASFTPPLIPYGQVDPSVLLHFDGSNGSTTFTDSSVNGLTLTPYGSAAISTAQSKFGGASGYFDGSNGSASATMVGYFSSNDFTIDTWFYLPSSITSTRNIASQWGNSDLAWHLGITGTNVPFFEMTGSGAYEVPHSILGAAISISAWHHFAAVRFGSTVTIYIDGLSFGSFSFTGDMWASNLPLYIGKDGSAGGNFFPGYIDEFRITKGVALYTANFAPPVAPYSAGGVVVIPVTVSTSSTGQSKQTVSGSFAMAYAVAITTGNAQSISASALESIGSASATSQASGSVAVVGNLYYYVPTSTGQVYQSFAGSISSADLVLIHTAQAQSSAAFARIANPISVNTATSQSHQSISLSLIPFITSNSSTGQSNQSISSSSVFSYFGAGSATRTKTTYTMGYVNRKWVMDKKRKLGGLSS